MSVEWSGKALDDLERVHDFLFPVAPEAAAKAVQSLLAGPDKLLEYPRIGERLDIYHEREVRRLIVGSYEVRYEITADAVIILRIWHCREDRDIA
jgi:plasmid stabilization system protein ParE